jgi:uncharacterized delta-60 repeat protein
LFFIPITFSVYAQPGSLDLSFNPTDTGFGNGDGANSDIRSIAKQVDGKIIIGGSFTEYNGFVMNRIARLNADGSLDTTFNIGLGIGGGTGTYVNSIFLQGDGKVLIGGYFGSYNGIARGSIARLNTDGSLDTTFNPGIDGYISSIAVQGDGKILIGGGFSICNGIARISIARLNNDGSLDTTFNPFLGMPANTSISCITIQSDGKILIGGSFTYYYYYNNNSNIILFKNITRFNNDGSIDTTFNHNPIPPPSLYITGTDGGIASIVLLGNGKVIIGGDFTTYNGTARGRIAELNADGSLDTTFNPGSGADSVIRSVAVQGDGKLLIGGDFTNFNGNYLFNIARLNADGSIDTTFNNTNYSLTTPIIYSVALQGNGKVLIGGHFTLSYGPQEKNIARLNVDGSTDPTFNPGTGADGSASIKVKANGKILIGGGFINYNGNGRNGIVQLNTDGSIDTTFNTGTGSSNGIACIAVQGDGKVLIGGSFTNFNGVAIISIARLNVDGSLDTTFNPGISANGSIVTIALQADGKVLIGGNFTNYNGNEINRIARLNTNGSLDTTFNPGTGFNGSPYTLVVQGDGKVLVGGSFTQFNGTARSGIVRLNTNGSLDTTFNPGSGTNGNIANIVNSIALQVDGKIIIGGWFTSYNGTSRNNIARIYANGTLDTAYNPSTYFDCPLYSLAIQGDDKVIIGALNLTNYTAFITRLNTNGTIDTVFNPGTGPNSTITSMAVQGDGKVLISGEFTSYNGIGRNRIARINGNTALSSIGFENNGLKIYPNPSNGVYNLQTNEMNTAKSISIYSILGQKIYDTVISSNETTIDISNQPKGVYLYKVFGIQGGTKSGKLVIE